MFLFIFQFFKEFRGPMKVNVDVDWTDDREDVFVGQMIQQLELQYKVRLSLNRVYRKRLDVTKAINS